MKVINTFMHDGRVLRPGDAVPSSVSDGELLAWKNHGLIGDHYAGPTRRSQPAPTQTKPTAPARKAATPKVSKPAAEPKPAETKGASDADADAQPTVPDADAQLVDDQAQPVVEGAEEKTE